MQNASEYSLATADQPTRRGLLSVASLLLDNE
jgi:hypothetical protein